MKRFRISDFRFRNEDYPIRNPQSPIQNSAGFTLLEVLLAVLVLGLSLTAFFGAVAQGMAVVGAARGYELSRSLMNQIDVAQPLNLEELDEGEDGGRFSGEHSDYRWRRVITRTGTENDQFFHIETRVEWGGSRDGGFERIETYLHLPSARQHGWIQE